MMKLSEVAHVLQAPFQGTDVVLKGVGIDTRSLKPGELFLALLGQQFNGHDFIEQAKLAGAAAAIIQENKPMSLPFIQVANTQNALAQLAAHCRAQFHSPIIAVTGSCGKTTTRSLLQNVMGQVGETLASEKSYNNHIGVPLTLLKIRPWHRYVVSELGANHPGEIAALTQIVKPTVAIITNAAAAHLQGFGSLMGVAQAKGEIFLGLPADGIAIINNDDHFASFWKKLVGQHRVVTFGLEQTANISATNIQLNAQAQPSFMLHTPKGNVHVQMQLMGEHNIYNALAAAAAGYSLGVPLQKIKIGLESNCGVDRRLMVKKGLCGSQVIDDSYNANPLSVAAALKTLAKSSGESILVLGDMLELGEASIELHRQLGEMAKQLGIWRLFCYGEKTHYTAEAFGKGAYHYTSQAVLIEELKSHLHEAVTILVKGSAGMKMQSIVKAIIAEEK